MKPEVRGQKPALGTRASVLGCGSAPPLSLRSKRTRPPQSARGLAQSKTWRLIVAAFFILHSAFCFRAGGQFSLDWSTIDGGGGSSTGGVYCVTGTIGQPDAGKMSGGNFTLDGGFWGFLAAVQSPGAPYLRVARTETNTVCICWAGTDPAWKLHATTNLVTTGSTWTEIPRPYATNATGLYFIESVPVGNKFYRLHKP
jgi:hypothetical protein